MVKGRGRKNTHGLTPMQAQRARDLFLTFAKKPEEHIHVAVKRLLSVVDLEEDLRDELTTYFTKDYIKKVTSLTLFVFLPSLPTRPCLSCSRSSTPLSGRRSRCWSTRGCTAWSRTP